MKSITTLCRDCVFSQYSIDTDGTPVQHGCDFDRIKRFRDNGVNILEASDDPEKVPPDGYKEFYAIENTICNMLRTPDWADKHIGESLHELVIRESQINYNWILVNKTEDSSQVRQRLIEIGKQDVKPARITFIRYPESPTEPNTIGTLINREKSLKIGWSIENLTNSETTEDEGIDLILAKNKTQFYFVSEVQHPIKQDISMIVNNLVNVELKRFGLLDIDNVRVGSTSVHINMQGGMFFSTFRQKLEELCPDKIMALR